METWRPLTGFDGFYEASDAGSIRNARTGRVLAPIRNGAGYHYVNLRREGLRARGSIHRTVWEAFHGPIPDGMEINHLNGSKLDNRLSNLEACSHADNVRHSHRVLGRKPSARKGVEHGRALLTEQDVLTIREVYARGGVTRSALARNFGVSKGCIGGILSRKNWGHI